MTSKKIRNKIEMINFCIWLDQPVLNDNYEAVEFVDDIKKLYTQPSSDIIDELEEKQIYWVQKIDFCKIWEVLTKQLVMKKKRKYTIRYQCENDDHNQILHYLKI